MSLFKESSFWLSNIASNSTGEVDMTDIMTRARIQKGISNFVQILTEENIPVYFKDGDRSYTTGEYVVISADTANDNLDVTVGVALHEGSHCKLTDFTFVDPENYIKYLKYGVNSSGTNLIDLALSKYRDEGITDEFIIDTLKYNYKKLINIVEDRRIDNFIYTTTPGFRGYYKAMYDYHWHAPIIDIGLQSQEARKPTFDAYRYRICNITNKHSDMKALPGLSEIKDLMHLDDINTMLKNTEDVAQSAKDILEIMINAIPRITDDARSDSDPTDSQMSDEPMDAPPSENKELTPEQKKQLDEALKKQMKFLDHDIEKEETEDEDINDKIRALESAKMKTEQIKDYEYNGIQPTVLIYRSLNEDVIKHRLIDIVLSTSASAPAVRRGLRMGKELGKKLQVRQEKRDLIYNRLSHGRLDSRLVGELGFKNDRIFTKTETTVYNPIHIHISIDASSSMEGQNMDQAIAMAVSIAKAADMTVDLDVVIDFRFTTIHNGNNVPAVLMAYDSRTDAFKKIERYFPFLYADGSTPEGLCFAAIKNEMINGKSNKDSYFINLSDGMPFFTSNWGAKSDWRYSGNTALHHTAKQIKEFGKKNIKVLSYFIGQKNIYRERDFRSMYGKEAIFINPSKVHEIANSMNKKFLNSKSTR